VAQSIGEEVTTVTVVTRRNQEVRGNRLGIKNPLNPCKKSVVSGTAKLT
jgi:hypothetical protein